MERERDFEDRPYRDRDEEGERLDRPLRERPDDHIVVPATGRPDDDPMVPDRERPGETERERPELSSRDPRLTTVVYLIADARELARPERSPDEVTDHDIRAIQDHVSQALPILIDLVEERVSQPGRSRAEVGREQAFLADLRRVRDSEVLRGPIPADRERRGRLVRGLQVVMAALAAAVVDFVLQSVLGALGVGEALGQATVVGAEAVRGMADQLTEALPWLATPALIGGHFTASIVLLKEASELLEASPLGWWSVDTAHRGTPSTPKPRGRRLPGGTFSPEQGKLAEPLHRSMEPPGASSGAQPGRNDPRLNRDQGPDVGSGQGGPRTPRP
jgi:hypothetical protein